MLVQIPTGFVLIKSSNKLIHRVFAHSIKLIRKDFFIHSSFLIILIYRAQLDKSAVQKEVIS